VYNNPLTTIDAVRDTIQNSYTEQAWLLIVLKSGGWADSRVKQSAHTQARIGTVRINDVNILARRETIELPTPTLSRITITVDFRVPGYDGGYSTVASLKHPTREDIRGQLSKLSAYTGYELAVQIADQAPLYSTG
jgi:hypothetical protein